MSEHFIQEIEIKNFKCFKDFKAEGFGRVNLIGGKNNVGKTAFMESCFISLAPNIQELYSRLLEITTHRNVINNLLSQQDKSQDIQKLIQNNENFNIITNNKVSKISVDENYDYNITLLNIEYHFDYSKLSNLLDIFFHQAKSFYSINFIAQDTSPNWLINFIVGKAKLEDKYELLNKYLNEVFDIKNIDTIDNLPYLKRDKTYEPLSEFGQGIKSFIEIVSSILFASKNIIFIDEIENGIHYTNLDKLWEIILTISKQQNVQVFATTHSKECIESYARVAKRLEDEEITYTILTKLEDGSIDAGVYNAGMLINTIEQDHEVRGW